MKTSIDNYFDRIKQIDVSKLPAPLAKGHDLAQKSSTGGTWKMYHNSETIKRVLDLYFEQLDAYIEGDDGPTPPTPAAVTSIPKPEKTPKQVREEERTYEALKALASKSPNFEGFLNSIRLGIFALDANSEAFKHVLSLKEDDEKGNEKRLLEFYKSIPQEQSEQKTTNEILDEEFTKPHKVTYPDKKTEYVAKMYEKKYKQQYAHEFRDQQTKQRLSWIVKWEKEFDSKGKNKNSKNTHALPLFTNSPEPAKEKSKSISEEARQKNLIKWVYERIGKTIPVKAIEKEFLSKAVNLPQTEYTATLSRFVALFNQFTKTNDKLKIQASPKTKASLENYLKNTPAPKHEYPDSIMKKLKEIDHPKPEKSYPDDIVERFNAGNEGRCYAVDFPIDQVHIDTKRFQNRKDAFSELSAQAVEKHFDPNKFDPIILWKDKTGKAFVISGHSRLEGMKRRKEKGTAPRHIPARFFEGTEQQAITFAKVEANRSQNREVLVEDIAAYKLMRDGDEKKGITAEPKDKIRQVFKEKTSALEHFAHLNPNGLFIQALSSDNTSEFPYLERTARWVGELRKKSGGAASRSITNLMEDNAFNFFYADKQGKNIKIAKDDFMTLVNKRLDTMKSSEKLLFTQDGQTINEAKRLLDDKLKGDGYRKLKEINELIRFINQRLKTTDRKLKVWTKQEEEYLRKELGPKLEAEKAKVEKDLNYLDKQQTLFGLNGIKSTCQCKNKGLNGNCGCKKKKTTKKRPPVRSNKNRKLNGIEAKPGPQVQPIKYEHPPVYVEDVVVGLDGTVEHPDVTATEETVTVTSEQVTTTRPKQLNGIPNNVMGYFQRDNRQRETFSLPTKAGRILGEIEQHEYALVLRGDKGAGKTRFLHRLMNAFAYKFPRIAFISLEIDQDSVQIDRLKAEYITPENQGKILTTSKATQLQDVEEIASNFPVVVIDSWSKIANAKPEDFDRIRKGYPKTIFLVIFQSTTNGTARGGLMPEYDAQAVFHVHEGGYVVTEKNRYGNGENIVYNVFTDELVDGDSVDLSV